MARAETALCVGLLLAMVLVASLQALCFNLAEGGLSAMRPLLSALSWADSFLQKGTLALAFVGASLATHDGRHVSIDVVAKIAPKRVARGLRAGAHLAAGVSAFVLSVAFYRACLVADAATPFEYEHLGPAGPLHLCDASGVDAPRLLCLLRGALARVGVSVSSGSGIAQLVAPVSLVVIGLRFMGSALSTLRGEGTDTSPPAAPGAPRPDLSEPAS